ncbi:MAG: hypothetical protein LBJ59_02285, partial [Zoogloeaceae bacterium]|nr:hypothetical protein [Zoogloeaceae bacterium]
MKQIFRLLFASLFFLTGQAMADMPEFTLGNVSVMGFAPDGRSVTRVDYSYYMGWGNTRVLWFFTLEDTRQYPKE